MKTSCSQSGVALLSVLFILVYISVFATYMVESDYLNLRRVQNLRDSELAYFLAVGSEKWSARILQRDLISDISNGAKPSIDYLDEDWNKLGPAVNVKPENLTVEQTDTEAPEPKPSEQEQPDQWRLNTQIADAQARFNINNLAFPDPNLANPDQAWLNLLKNILRLALKDFDENKAGAIADWLDANSQHTQLSGAEDQDYLLLDPPYRAANHAIPNIGEIMAVKGFNDAELVLLAPLLTALPIDPGLLITKINVNTCSALMLEALGISTNDTVTILQDRALNPFETIDDFFIRLGVDDTLKTSMTPLIDVKSNFFEVTSSVEYGRIRQAMVSLVKRDVSTKSVSVIARHRRFL